MLHSQATATSPAVPSVRAANFQPVPLNSEQSSLAIFPLDSAAMLPSR
jgi:hypothetical protein